MPHPNFIAIFFQKSNHTARQLHSYTQLKKCSTSNDYLADYITTYTSQLLSYKISLHKIQHRIHQIKYSYCSQIAIATVITDRMSLLAYSMHSASLVIFQLHILHKCCVELQTNYAPVESCLAANLTQLFHLRYKNKWIKPIHTRPNSILQTCQILFHQ